MYSPRRTLVSLFLLTIADRANDLFMPIIVVDFSEMLLLVAAESGVLRSDLNGNMAMNIGEERSRESNGN